MLRDLQRLLSIGTIVTLHVTAFSAHALYYFLVRFKPTTLDVLLARQTAKTFERCGGGFLKIGQVLSTRVDLMPGPILSEFKYLQDSVRPLPIETVVKLLESSLGAQLDEVFSEFDFEPVASASIAQVHRARLVESGELVAVKVRRPGITIMIECDTRIVLRTVKFLCKFRPFSEIPAFEAMEQVSASLLAQTDFRRELIMLQRFGRIFERARYVSIPEVFSELCTDDVIVMEFMSDLTKINAPGTSACDRRDSMIVGLRALYTMIFLEGLIHCDMHSSNIFRIPNGIVVILDAGFVHEMSAQVRQSFSEFFLAIAFANATEATRIVIDVASEVPSDLNMVEVESDITRLLEKYSGKAAKDFQVALFVSGLFNIQRSHGIYGSPSFTLAILSLLVYEGLVKECDENLDFQSESVPFLMTSLLAAN